MILVKVFGQEFEQGRS